MKTLLLSLSLLVAGSTFSQATSEGDTFFDFGIGYGRAHGLSYNSYSYNSGYYNTGNFNAYNGAYQDDLKIPTLSVTLQKAFWDDITIGGFGAFNVYGYDWERSDFYSSESREVRELSIILGARGEYHFNRLIGWDDKFDAYAGVIAGVRIWNYKGVNEGVNSGGSWKNEFTDNGVGPIGGVLAGFRYFFSNNLAVYAEAGYAVTSLRAGLCWKL